MTAIIAGTTPGFSNSALATFGMPNGIAALAQGNNSSLKNSVRLANSSGFGDEFDHSLRTDRLGDAAIG